MKNRTAIRAEDYLPEPEESGGGESFQLSRSEGMLINLFGALPDYSDSKFEKLWQKVFDAEDVEMIAYCMEKGVDVLETNVGGKYTWDSPIDIVCRVAGNELELAIPITTLTGGKAQLPDFLRFKWADNIQQTGEWSDFTLNGDVAPNDRYNYRAVFR